MKRMLDQKTIDELQALLEVVGRTSTGISVPSISIADNGFWDDSGIQTGGDIMGKTLEQSEANWSAEITPVIPATSLAKGLTLTPVYNKCEVINGILYFVLVNKLNNPTETDITIAVEDSVQAVIENIPNNIASKVFDIQGNAISEIGSGTVDIQFNTGGIEEGVSYVAHRQVITHNGQNSLRITIERNSAYTLVAGKSTSIFSRVFLTLL